MDLRAIKRGLVAKLEIVRSLAWVCLLFGVLGLGTTPAFATNNLTADIGNNSFETPTLGCPTNHTAWNNGAVPVDWSAALGATGNGSQGYQGGVACDYNGNTNLVPNGYNAAIFYNQYNCCEGNYNYIYQEVENSGTPIAAVKNGSYALTVEVGAPLTSSGYALSPFEIELLALPTTYSGNTPVSSASEVIAQLIWNGSSYSSVGTSSITATPSNGAFDLATLTGKDTLTGNYDLYVVLGNDYAAGDGGNGDFVWYDEVTLTSSPEPASLAIFGAALIGFGWFYGYRRRSIKQRPTLANSAPIGPPA